MISQHRHRDLCGHLEITPFEVVLDYTNALHATGNLPVEMLPVEMLASWDQSDPVPEPVPELEQAPGMTPVPEPTPTPKAKRSRKRNATMTASYPKSDIIMEESTGPSVAISTRKAKGRAQPHLLPTPSETRETTSDVRNAGSKRMMSDSPQERGLSKRMRRASRLPRPAPRLDLSQHTFPEDSLISTELVPALKGEVSLAGHRCISV